MGEISYGLMYAANCKHYNKMPHHSGSCSVIFILWGSVTAKYFVMHIYKHKRQCYLKFTNHLTPTDHWFCSQLRETGVQL